MDNIPFLGVSPEKIGVQVCEIPLKETKRNYLQKGNKYDTYRFCFQYLQASFESGGASKRQRTSGVRRHRDMNGDISKGCFKPAAWGKLFKENRCVDPA